MEELIYKDLRNIFKENSPPFSYLFLDEMDKNIELALKRAGDKEIRIASKSVRSVSVLKYLIEKLGSRCTGLMCFHLEEVLWLSDQIKTQFLMGYPQRPTHDQMKKIASKIKDDALDLVFMIDSVEQLKDLNEQAKTQDINLKICLDLDMSLRLPGLNFGVWRSPLDNTQKVTDLLGHIKSYPHLSLVGLMGYEAQIAGVGDQIFKNPILNSVIAFLKKLSHKKIYNLRAFATKKASELFQLEFVNGGGTGSLEMTAKDKAVTEITVGSGFYAPALFDSYHKKFHPSLGYAMAVQRKPSEFIFTVHGGGYVASGSVGDEKAPVVMSPKGAVLTKNEMAGEVQTPVLYKGLQQINLGDPIFFRHSKAGELLERFTTMHIIRDNKIEDKWTSYRGDGQCFL